MNGEVPRWAVRLRDERRNREWSQRDMARHLVGAAGEETRGHLPSRESIVRNIKNWEAGKRQPKDPYRVLYARAFGIIETELFADKPNTTANDADKPRERTLDAKASTRDEDDDVERRRLMRDAAAVAAGGVMAPVFTTLTNAWQASQPRIPGASVSQEMIDDWEDAADVHAKAARVARPASVLAALAADFADMAPHLARRQPDAVRRDLTHAAARHAALIAGKWMDIGNRRESHRWWSTTRGLVDESGDRLLASWLRLHEAVHRAHDPVEGPVEALAVTQEARRLAGQGPSAPLAVAMAEEAMTLAAMGRHTEAVAALRAADDVFDRLPSVGGQFRGVERELRFYHSSVHSLGGDEKRAGEAQDSAERSYPPGDQALPRIRLHRAVLHARTDPAEAVNEALRIVTGIPPERWLTRYAADTQRVFSALPEKARTLPAARELRALTGDRLV